MRRIWFGLVALVVGGVTVGTGPATAAPAPCEVSASNSAITLDVDSPTEGDTWTTSDVTFAGDFAHTGSATLTSPAPHVSSVTIQVRACDNEYEAPPPSDDRVRDTARSGRYEWTTHFGWNGRYVAQVSADGTDGQRSVRRRAFSVEVPPSAPTGEHASVADGVVTVTWNKNPEPDVVLYEVDRTRPGFADRQVWAVSGSLTTFKDEPGPGDYSYQIIAIRRDATGGQGIKGEPSGSVAASIPEPPPPSTTASSGSGGSTGTNTGSPGTGSTRTGTGGGTPGSSARSPAVATTPGGLARTGRVDLSDFSALLNSRGGVPQGAYIPGAPDPGFDGELPFDPRQEAEESVEEAAEEPEGPERLVQQLVSDDSDRRRSVGFLASGLLLFVMSMLGMWVKGEVNRFEDLEAVDGEPAPEPDPEPEPEPHPEPEPEPEVVSAVPDPEAEFADPEPVPAAASILPRRVRRELPPLDAPGLDVPQPVPSPAATARTRTSNARRAPSRLPSRPADHRREGGAPVRAGRGGAGGGNRRVSVG